MGLQPGGRSTQQICGGSSPRSNPLPFMAEKKRTVLIQIQLNCVFRFRFIACIQIQSFSGRFIFLHLSTLPRSDFLGSHVTEKRNRLVLFWARALQSFYFYVFFHGVCKRCNEPEMSGDWTDKYHKTALLFITHLLYWTFLYLLSVIGIISRYLLVLTYFDSSRRHTHETTHATGTQIVRAKMTSLDAIFCRGNKSSSRSLARFYRIKTV